MGRRISWALTGVRVAERRLPETIGSPRSYFWLCGQYLDNAFITDPSVPVDLSIYPELRTRRFQSLIVELQELVEAPQKEALTNPPKVYESFLTLGSLPETKPELKAAQDALADATKSLHELSQPRWARMVR